MEVTYDYYRIFYYVAKYKSFSKAADVLGSNQPNITKFMNNLESQLSCQLLVRSNRGVSLTPEGERLYAHVTIAYEHLQEAEMELTDDRSLQNGNVSLGCSESALHGILLPVLESFHALYPGVHLSISNLSTSQALQSLRSGVADFAVVTTPVNSLAHYTGTRLSVFHDILIGSKQYRYLCDKALTYQDILRFPLIGLGQETMSYEYFSQLFLQNGLVWKLDTQVATANQLLPMIECSLGIGFIPDFFAKEAIEEGRVFSIPLERKPPEREILLVENKGRHLSIAAKELRQMLLERSRGICRHR